jgi:hypothetical protein
MQNPNKRLCNKTELSALVGTFKPGVVLMMGAGDIDTLVLPVKEELLKNENS